MTEDRSLVRETVTVQNKRTTLKLICTFLVEFYIKHKLSQSAMLCICNLIYIVLKIVANPMYHVFPTTLYRVFKNATVCDIKKEKYVVCPNDSCNHLYSLEEAQMLKVCNVITFGSKCGKELGYIKKNFFTTEVASI